MESVEDLSRFKELTLDEGEYSGEYRSSESGSRSPSGERHRSWSPWRRRTRSRSRSRRSRRRSRSRRSSSRADHSEAAVEEAKLLMESDVIKFCEKHKLEMQVSSCLKCRLVTRSVGNAVLSELLRLMKAKASSDSIPSAAERYASKLDKRAPTLTFTESDLALAVCLFSRGRMSPPSLFDDLTKEYLLPQNQNDTLTKSVQLEMLFKYKIDKYFSLIFLYVEQMSRVAKHLRISKRPVILAMGELTRFMNAVKSSDRSLGFQYPDQAPLVQLMGPRKVKDELAYRQLPDLPLPLPTLDILLKDTMVSAKDKNTIVAILLSAKEKLKEHMRDLSNKLGFFMDTISASVNRLNSFLSFHLDLFAHCDSEVTYLMMNKDANLFNPSYRLQPRVREGRLRALRAS